jgi:hypothetical protein
VRRPDEIPQVSDRGLSRHYGERLSKAYADDVRREGRVSEKLTSSDPQPGLGAIVRDIDGREWENTGGEEGSWRNWQQTDVTQTDPETWVKVAGNYGPVTLISEAI